MKDESLATKRSHMPTGTNSVLDRRTLARDNKNLLPLLKKGMHVMDVGCGSGAITKGIADLVGETGSVIGLDTSHELISLAKGKYDTDPHLSFHCGDVMTYETDQRFDLITTARTLQWMDEPKEALNKMKGWLKKGGCLTALDYNHEKIKWQPSPPASMLHFYSAFLNWREDAGMDNQIADHLENTFSQIGFTSIMVTDCVESCSSTDDDFAATAGIWKKVAETRGQQLVKDGYVTEHERLQAIDEYDRWIARPTRLAGEGASMSMYLLAATGHHKQH